MTSRTFSHSMTIRLGRGRFPAEATAEISGRHIPMRWGPEGGSPEEWPEVDIVSVVLLDDDDIPRIDVTTALTSDELEVIADAVCLAASEDERERYNDAMEREADLRREK